MNNKIIVIGGNHHNTLAVLRSLGEKGVKSMLIVVSQDSKPFVGYSKYIQELRVVKFVEEISSAMYALHHSSDTAVVIACADSISSYLDSNRNRLSKNFVLPCSLEEGKITRLMNKNIMMEVAIESGILVPKSWIVYSVNPEISHITYPCIVKPLVSKNGSKADIVVCERKSELEYYLNHCNCEELQIQEYIIKDIEFQLIGCSLNGGEEVIIPGASIILRQPQNTNTGFLRYLPIREFSYDRKSCVEFIRKTGYSGLFSLEFIRDKKGADYFMEINFRNDGNSICVTASGMNLPYIWYLSNNGLNYEKELCYDTMKEVLVMPEFEDFANVKNGNISIFKWIRDVYKTDRFMDFSKHDQRPFWIRLYKSIIGKILK